jgi:hypothetical protein
MKKDKKWTNQLLGLAKKSVESIDKDAIKKGVTEANKAKDAAVNAKNEISEKITELDRKLEQRTVAYNDAFTLMNDKGVKLFVERNRAVDTIVFTEALINSIANHPASFDTDFEAIKADRKAFSDSCEFANRELENARKAAGGGGMAPGNALLAMAGPIGWTIAGATLLTSIILYSKNKVQLNKEKAARIADIERNTESVKEIDEKLKVLLKNTHDIREGVNAAYQNCMPCYGKNYAGFSSEQKMMLGNLVNETKALSALFRKTIA